MTSKREIKWTDFGQILYCSSLIACPACFKTFTTDNQSHNTRTEILHAINRANVPELLRYAHIPLLPIIKNALFTALKQNVMQII